LQTITQNIVKCYLWKVKEKVGGVFDDRALLAEFASWVLELSCVDQFATLVALISPSIRVRTQRAFSLHKTVCQKPVATFAQKLLHGFSQGEPILVQLQKQVLTNPKKSSFTGSRANLILKNCLLGLVLVGRTTKVIKVNVEPLVNLVMDLF
jgi:hypothetical protein